MLPEVYSFNDKLLIYNGALAIDQNCCCGNNICCYCIEAFFYYWNDANNPYGGNQRRLGILTPPQGPPLFGFWQCFIVWLLPDGTATVLRDFVRPPAGSIFLTKRCFTPFLLCRFGEYVWNTADNKAAQGFYSEWFKDFDGRKLTACNEDIYDKPICEKCRELEVTPEPGEDFNNWILKLNDLCGVYKTGNIECCQALLDWNPPFSCGCEPT